MPGLEESIPRDTSPPTHSLMSDGIVSEQIKKFLFTSRKTQDNVQCNENLEIYIPEVIKFLLIILFIINHFLLLYVYHIVWLYIF